MLVDKKKKKRSAEIPTSSLADMAFLLLVFFLVTTTIDVDKGIGLVLPQKGETIEVRTKNICNLLVNAEGKVMIDDQVIEPVMIKSIIQRKLIENDKLIVSVKTDAATKYRYYIQVLDQLKQAWGNKKTRISIAEPER
ncbi:biopolymer transporter ExbD [candidate division KSB1 bacterium]|nr:biopolymer transporter ExbD [candidate division KSB1 bacterium]MBL7093002.1 biopolymer transporter ExbD [candidate division KSB1 bacterium]